MIDSIICSSEVGLSVEHNTVESHCHTLYLLPHVCSLRLRHMRLFGLRHMYVSKFKDKAPTNTD